MENAMITHHCYRLISAADYLILLDIATIVLASAEHKH
jgi:hypothetical protein